MILFLLESDFGMPHSTASCVEVPGHQYHALFLSDEILEEVQLLLEVEYTLVGEEVAADIRNAFAPHLQKSVSDSMCITRNFPWIWYPDGCRAKGMFVPCWAIAYLALLTYDQHVSVLFDNYICLKVVSQSYPIKISLCRILIIRC